MGLAVMYEMTALEGEGGALGQALDLLAHNIRALPGCAAVHFWADSADARRFVFIEQWPSQAVYDAGAKLLPPEAFAPLKPLLDGKPGRRVLIEQ
jgi:quinol monooxygenase YgiN